MLTIKFDDRSNIHCSMRSLNNVVDKVLLVRNKSKKLIIFIQML